MSEYSDKITKAKAIADKNKEVKIGLLSAADIEGIHKSIADTHGIVKQMLEERSTEATETNTEQYRRVVSNLDDIKNVLSIPAPEVDLQPLENAIKSIDVRPVVNVPQTKVINTIEQPDIFEIFKPADGDERGANKYYGFTDRTGRWFILRDTESSDKKSSYRYAFGSSNYKNAWINRQRQDYMYYYEVNFDGSA